MMIFSDTEFNQTFLRSARLVNEDKVVRLCIQIQLNKCHGGNTRLNNIDYYIYILQSSEVVRNSDPGGGYMRLGASEHLNASVVRVRSIHIGRPPFLCRSKSD